jgi:hypothetical protein
MSALTYTKLPNPLRDGDLLYHDPDAVVNALEDAARGAPLNRVARGAEVPPEEAEVRGLESRLRRAAASRSRGEWGRAIWWALLGPALALLLVNRVAPFVAQLFFWSPPLAQLVGSLGAVTGGPLLATAVGVAPMLWAWARAGRHLAEARRWGRLARLAGTRRLGSAGLVRTADPAVAAFAGAVAPLLARLRERAGGGTAGGGTAGPGPDAAGPDAAGDAAVTARDAFQLAQRHGLPGVAGAFHALYTRFDAAEQRLNRIERAGGVLAERKMEGEARRARRQAGAGLAAFSPTGPVRSRLLAPLAGLLGGLVVLAVTLFITGTYFVSPGEAVIVDPVGARLSRLAGVFGLASQGAQAPPEVVRTEGFHLGWPLPLADRHAVTLQEQRLRLRATFRQTGPDLYDVLEVQMSFRISDPNRWAQIDRDGTGVDALGLRLSGLLQTVLQQQRQEARRFVAAQNPAVANDPNQLGAQADALVEQRLPDTVRDFVAALSDSSVVRDAGVQVSRDAPWRLARGVSGADAAAGSSG